MPPSFGSIPIKINPKLIECFIQQPNMSEDIFGELIKFTYNLGNKPFSTLKFINGATKILAHHEFSLSKNLSIIIEMLAILTADIEISDKDFCYSFTINNKRQLIRTNKFGKVIAHIIHYAW